MTFTKTTPDRFFKLTIESELLSYFDDNEQIPAESLLQLIMELEILAAELRDMLGPDEELPKPN